jgi:hypothetical protein
MKRLIKHETLIEIWTYDGNDTSSIIVERQLTDHKTGWVTRESIKRTVPGPGESLGAIDLESQLAQFSEDKH